MTVAVSFFRSTALAAALIPLADMMEKANGWLFKSDYNMTKLAGMLQKTYNECSVGLKHSKFEVYDICGERPAILVYQNSTNGKDSDIRLHFIRVKGIMDYDDSEECFFMAEDGYDDMQ